MGAEAVQKPAAEVAADIRQHGARKAIFVDLNLIADRDYAVDLFTALAPLDIEWYGLSTVLIAGDLPLLDLAARSGCRGLLIGFESLVNENVRGSGKVFNRRMTPEALRDCCRDARRAFYGPTSIVRRMTNLRANARTPSHLGLFLAANLVSRREIASKLGRPLGARPGRQPTDAARAVPIRTAPAAVVSVGTRVKEESS